MTDLPESSADPISNPEGEIERLLAEARASIRDSLENVVKARDQVDSFEDRVILHRARRRAALDSLALTNRACKASGLDQSAMMLWSLKRLQQLVEEATKQIHATIVEAQPACELLTRAHEVLRVARLAEIEANSLRRDEKVLHVSDQPEDASSSRGRLAGARDQLIVEKEERERGLAWLDGHYDPRYDDRELLLRRARPWV